MLSTLAFLSCLLTYDAFRTPRRSTSKGQGDECIKCLKSADDGIAGCDTSCIGKSIECQSCVHWEEDADCAALCVQGGEGDGSASKDDKHKPKENISDVKPNVTASDEVQAEHHINWYDWNSKVSTYFTVGEVCQWDWRRIPTSSAIKNDIVWLARELDQVRVAWGGSIIVNSWYRPPDVNWQVGGASNSQHLYGRAADIRPGNGDLWGMQNWLDWGLWANRALGYGASCCGFVHLDLRNGRIRWNYR